MTARLSVGIVARIPALFASLITLTIFDFLKDNENIVKNVYRLYRNLVRMKRIYFK